MLGFIPDWRRLRTSQGSPRAIRKIQSKVSQMTDKANTPPPADLNLTAANPGLKKLLLGAGWTFSVTDADVLDVDFSCFALNRENLTREDTDFIFYNSPQGADLSIKHLGDNRAAEPDGTDDEAIMVDLDTLSFDVWRIVFVLSIYQGNDRDHSFAGLRNATIRIENADSGEEIHRFTFDGSKLGTATAVRVLELYRNGSEWFAVPLHEGAGGGLAEIAGSYGLLISSTT